MTEFPDAPPEETLQYSKIVYLLQQLNCELHAAEVHGLMCGLLCVENIDEAYHHLTSYVLQHSHYELLENEEQTLYDYFHISHDQLFSNTFSLEILLPDDEESLVERVNALAYWCQGFLTGLSLVQRTLNDIDARHKSMARMIEEITIDFSRIADMQSHYVESQASKQIEEDEVYYTELVEYTRITVLTLYTEISPLLTLSKRTYH